MRALFDGPQGIFILLLVIVMFGAKRLPDAARSLGRSIRIFKAEMEDIPAKAPEVTGDSEADTKN